MRQLRGVDLDSGPRDRRPHQFLSLARGRSRGESTYQHLQNPRAICPMPTTKPKEGRMALGQNALVARHGDQA
jgi:hypothetical protein